MEHIIGCLLLLLVFRFALNIHDWKCCALLVFLSGIAVELFQYVFQCGTCDWKDIVSNGIGMCLGILILTYKGGAGEIKPAP